MFESTTDLTLDEMTLKTRLIPCLDVKDGRTRAARSNAVARTGKSKNRRDGDGAKC